MVELRFNTVHSLRSIVATVFIISAQEFHLILPQEFHQLSLFLFCHSMLLSSTNFENLLFATGTHKCNLTPVLFLEDEKREITMAPHVSHPMTVFTRKCFSHSVVRSTANLAAVQRFNLHCTSYKLFAPHHPLEW